MKKLKKYNLKGEALGGVNVASVFSEAGASSHAIKEYIVAIRANARQWSASTKGRSEVKHTTKKPHPQKKLGRARQGSLVSPQFRGGGIVFGPKPKFDQHIRINKKERRQVIRHLIAEKICEGKAVVLEDCVLESPKTKMVASFLKGLALKGKVLFLAESNFDEVEASKGVKRVMVSSAKHVDFIKSIRNIREASFTLASNVNGYDITRAQNIVITEKALPELEAWLER